MAEKHNAKKYPLKVCEQCGVPKAIISKYHLMLCRRCFKDVAVQLGFRKYN